MFARWQKSTVVLTAISAYMQIELILKNFAEDKYREPEIQDQLHNLRQNVQQMAIHLKSIKRILQKQRIRH